MMKSETMGFWDNIEVSPKGGISGSGTEILSKIQEDSKSSKIKNTEMVKKRIKKQPNA